MSIIQEVQLDVNQLRWKEKALKSIKKYQQGALYLATGIGKSYVAKDIINDYLKEDSNAQILWIAPASAMNNIKLNFFESYDNIIFESFENLRIKEDNIDVHEFSNLKLIIIDEAHKALASKTWISINYILEKFTDRRNKNEFKRAKKGKSDLLVLTASGVRSCDSKKVFEELTNRLEEHVDYEVVDLHEAIEQDLLGKIHFLNNNIGKYELMADTIVKQLSAVNLDESFKEKRNEIQSILDYINEYKNNMPEYLGKDINSKIQNIYDGSNGDQWIVFYSRVKDALNSDVFLRDLFKNIYKHNSNIKINIYQYHNALSEHEIENANRLMYSKPDKDTVNVYVTVNKGVTSIHPENVVGEIQFRSTYSQNLYEQSIGRVTKSKSHSNREVFVIDVVDNANRVIKDGYSKTKAIKQIEDIEKTENDLANKLREDFLNNIDFELINEKFDKVIEEFNKLKHLSDISGTVSRIAEIIDSAEGCDYKFTINKSPYVIISQNTDKEEAYKLNFALKTIQEKFINKEFGEHNLSNIEQATPLYKMIYDKLGYILFFNFTNNFNLVTIPELISMANKINRGTKCENYKELLNIIRIAYIKGELPRNVIEFCNFNNINLRGNGEELMRIAVGMGIIKSIPVLKLFNDLSKKLGKAENGDDEDLIRAYALYYYVNCRYSSTVLMRAINLTYDCINRFDTIVVSESLKNWINALESIYKMDKLGTAEELPINKRHINISNSDTDLARLAYYIESGRNFSLFEKELLSIYNIKVDAINKNIVADKVMELTSINNLVNRLENEERTEFEVNSYIRALKDININKLPSKWYTKVKGLIEKHDEEIDNYSNEIKADEVIDLCREKINTLEYISELKAQDFEQIKRIYKKAHKLNIDNETLISTCFPTIYIDHLIPAFKRMKTNNMNFDDFLAVNGTIDMGDEYIGKLAFLLKFDLIGNEYIEMSKKLINKQIEFK